MFVIAFVLGVITVFYIWMKWNYSFWKRNKVPGPEPSLIVGNVGPTFTFSEHWAVVTANWYREFPNEPYIGYYKMLRPAIIARDPDLIKDILITNFNKFRNNDFLLSKKQDPLSANIPFFAKDEEWKESRKTILPAFSTNKIKSLIPVMNGVGEDFVKFIETHPQNMDFDAKHLCLRFTTENVIKCCFSIDPGCYNKEKDSEFLVAGRGLFEPSFFVGIKFLAMPILPLWALDLFPVSFVPAFVDRTFRDLVRVNKASRSNNNQSNDIFQMLLQIQEKYNLDDTFLAGHSIALFMDGTETSSATLAYTLYELARNPHCQEKLFDEITATMNKYDGKLTAEGLHEMIYLEGVMLEALRIHPGLMTLSKVCNEEYTLPKTSGQSEAVTIYPGTVVNIPLMGVHMDPKYYPNPEEFQPERFNEEEQRNRHSGTYLGFGIGPRICSGIRFASAQLKVALTHIVKNFRIKLSPEQKPIVIDPKTLLSFPKDGILIQFERR